MTTDSETTKEYNQYLEDLYNELNKDSDDYYTFTFKIYKVVDLETDLKQNKPVRVRVSLSGEAEIDVIDQYFIYDVHHFFDKNFGEMIIEKEEKSATFTNIKHMQEKLFKGKDYILV